MPTGGGSTPPGTGARSRGMAPTPRAEKGRDGEVWLERCVVDRKPLGAPPAVAPARVCVRCVGFISGTQRCRRVFLWACAGVCVCVRVRVCWCVLAMCVSAWM